ARPSYTLEAAYTPRPGGVRDERCP
ncbi:hypothetical protein CFC21_020548, partial [Triticum aestivum]